MKSNRSPFDLRSRTDFDGFSVLNISPLAMGQLTNQSPPPWHPASDAIKATCAAAFCRSRGADFATLGMQHCYAEPRIPSTITGTAKRRELEANLKTLATPMDERLLKDALAVFEPVRDELWASGNE